MKIISILIAIFAACACGHSDGGIGGNESEVITTVELTFAPEGGGEDTTAIFNDADGDGGDAPVVDLITLSSGGYTMSVRFENRLEDPAEDITVEIADESDEHQVFFTGTAVDGPASDQVAAPLAHEYGDNDRAGLPVGLLNTVTARAGEGELSVTLRHLPALAGTAVKTADLPSKVRNDGFAAIGGASDVQVTFAVEVE